MRPNDRCVGCSSKTLPPPILSVGSSNLLTPCSKMDSLADFSTIQLLSAATGLFVAAIVLYRTFLSPISDIPGPFVARFSIAWQLWILVKGRVGPEMARLHKKHGQHLIVYRSNRTLMMFRRQIRSNRT